MASIFTYYQHTAGFKLRTDGQAAFEICHPEKNWTKVSPSIFFPMLQDSCQIKAAPLAKPVTAIVQVVPKTTALMKIATISLQMLSKLPK